MRVSLCATSTSSRFTKFSRCKSHARRRRRNRRNLAGCAKAVENRWARSTGASSMQRVAAQRWVTLSEPPVAASPRVSPSRWCKRLGPRPRIDPHWRRDGGHREIGTLMRRTVSGMAGDAWIRYVEVLQGRRSRATRMCATVVVQGNVRSRLSCAAERAPRKPSFSARWYRCLGSAIRCCAPPCGVRCIRSALIRSGGRPVPSFAGSRFEAYVL